MQHKYRGAVSQRETLNFRLFFPDVLQISVMATQGHVESNSALPELMDVSTWPNGCFC